VEPKPLRAMIYDASCRGPRALPGLSQVWGAGGRLYRGLGRIDHILAATSWHGALSWLANIEGDRPLAEIQFWGHGRWGRALIDGEALSEASLDAGHAHRPLLDEVRRRVSGDSLWWFRTCETFGAGDGQNFARAWTRHFQCRAAGHTFIIAFWQSGLHSLTAGEEPSWSPEEGLREGSAERPVRAHWSKPWRPNTISCLSGRIPDGY